MATTDTANFYYNFSITDPYKNRNKNFPINKSLPAKYLFCCFHPWPSRKCTGLCHTKFLHETEDTDRN